MLAQTVPPLSPKSKSFMYKYRILLRGPGFLYANPRIVWWYIEKSLDREEHVASFILFASEMLFYTSPDSMVVLCQKNKNYRSESMQTNIMKLVLKNLIRNSDTSSPMNVPSQRSDVPRVISSNRLC
ncbi:hypothetical protein TNCT_379291 [Trichonephila clavata]|uniref:Uncharacterized protein n=1 Tax=Trichonephila clavata TaxID=2740835 RepID=A0A8X6FT85_TRICU|nr:hypothetical protein TNCT_379291 [Trichonephila clavata]